jgi:hypothetical protein
MIVQNDEMNQLSLAGIEQIVIDAGGEIDEFLQLPFLSIPVFRDNVTGPFEGFFAQFTRSPFVVSVSDFNRFTGSDISLNDEELLIATNLLSMEEAEYLVFETLITTSQILNTRPSRDEFLQSVDTNSLLIFESENTRINIGSTINSQGIMSFFDTNLHVISDDIWDSLQTDATGQFITFNLLNGDPEEVQTQLVNALEEINGWLFTENSESSFYRPISRQEAYTNALQANAFFIFTSFFVGLILLSAMFVVLYHKFVADMDEEMETISRFKRIGLNQKECRAYLSKHLGVVFFVPILLGGIPALFMVSRIIIFRNMQTPDFIRYFSLICGLYLIIVIFIVFMYTSLRRKFFKEMKLN